MQNQKLFFLSWFIICATTPTFSQANLQSLVEQAKIEIAQKKYNEALITYEEALIIAVEKQEFEEKAKIENNLGVVHWNLENYAKSIHFYEQALLTNEVLENDTLVAGSHFNLGLVLKKIGSNDLAIAHFLEAIKLFHQLKNLNAEAAVYVALGNLHYNLTNYEKAIEYYELGKSIYKGVNDLKGISSTYHNLAQVYLDKDELEHCFDYLKYDRALKVNLDLSTSSNSALFAKYYQQQNLLDSAEYYYQLSFHERLNEGAQNRIALGYYHLGDFYYQKGDFLRANEKLDRAYFISDSLNLKPLMIEIIKLKIDVNDKLNQSGQNNILYPELIRLKDETLGEKNRLEIARFDVAFETTKKENEIALKEQALSYELKNNQSLRKQNTYLVIIATIILFLILTVICFYYKLRQKTIKLDRQNEDLEKKNTIIEDLHREFNHRMVNYFQMFGGMLAHDIKKTHKNGEKQLLMNYYNRINAMSQIQHYLLHENKSMKTNVMLDFYLGNLIDEVGDALNNNASKVKIVKKIGAISVDYDKAIRLGIALNELMQNAFKHGFKDILQPQLEISLESDKESLILTVADNGVGITEKSNDKKNSMGLDLIRSLLNSIKGKIKYYDLKRGMKIEIKLMK